MGPTTYIPRTFNEASKLRMAFDVGQATPAREEMLGSAKNFIATLKAGDAAIFDTRTLHAGTANTCSKLSRVLFNITCVPMGSESAQKGRLGKDWIA